MARVLRRFIFSATGTTGVPVGNQINAGRIAVYARRVSGTGTATLAVRGGFTDDLDDTSNDTIQITGPTAEGTGALTVITADSQTPFAHLVLIHTLTGTATSEVFVTAY